MIYALIALVLFSGMSWLLVTWGEDGYDFRHLAASVIGFFGSAASLIGAALYFFFILQWIGAEQKANIINREYGTNYTQAEVFYASDVIDTIRQIDRKRYEVNGDLFREKSDKK